MASTETISPKQLKLARTALWHQNGDALRTMDDARTWLEAAGLVSYYPHAQFAAAPQPSFAEAVLGRPETGWVPNAPKPFTAAAVGAEDEDTGDEGLDDDDLDEESDGDDDFDEDEDLEDGEKSDEESDDEDFDDDEDEDLDEGDDEEHEDAEDEDDEETAEPETAKADGSHEASDPEVMLSNDDEFAEDEGDEIAEIDRIHAGDDPLPNDLDEGSTSTSGAEEESTASEPAPEPINGFSADEKATVSRQLARMVAEGSAVPLNLLGSTTGEPDFVCSAQAFSFVYTLRGDKGWKTEPSQTGSMRVSPLAVKVHALLKEKGPMAPHELSQELGQGIVDSAVLRALSELWAIQRVIPVPDPDGAPTKWELLTGRFVRHLKAGSNAGQPTALSALLSLYLSKAVAASSDEMEIFLSPLSARSRVREVVGGLAASRQLDSLVLEGKTLMFMPGALDQLPVDAPNASEPVSVPRSRYADDDRRAMIEERSAKFGAAGGEDRKSSYPVRRPAGARAEGERGGRPGGPRTGGFSGSRPGGPRPGSPRPGGFGGSRLVSFGGDRSAGGPPRREGGFGPPRRTGSFGGPREGGFGARPGDRERRPFVRREEGSASGASERPRNEFARPWENDGGEQKSFTPREGAPERRPFTPREGSERRPFAPRGDRPFTPRGDGERRPFTPREGGERRPFAPRGDRPFTPREGGDSRPFTPRGDRPFPPREGGERRPFTPAGGGERRPSTPREGGERRPSAPRGDRPFAPRGDGERRPFTPREGGERRPFTPRGDGERRPFPPREGGDRKPFAPRGDRPFTPRGDGERRPFTPREGGGERRPFTPRGDGERRPFTPREGGGERRPFAPRGDRPFTPRTDGERRPFTPREGGERKPFSADRAGSGSGRPSFGGTKSSGPGGAKFGGSGFGRDRGGSGGFSKPGFSPARRGPGSGPGRGGAPKRRPE